MLSITTLLTENYVKLGSQHLFLQPVADFLQLTYYFENVFLGNFFNAPVFVFGSL
jgi:hypothetical protein